MKGKRVSVGISYWGNNVMQGGGNTHIRPFVEHINKMGGKDAGMGDVGYFIHMIARVWRKDGFVITSCVMLGMTDGSSRSMGLQ